MVALLFCDVDGFKNVNDEYGHRTGDELLRTIASRLTSVVRPEDTVARIGGDEFVVLIDSAISVDDIAAVAARMRAAVSEPIAAGPAHFDVTMSIGIAVSIGTDPPTTPEALLHDADEAMYKAKRQGPNVIELFDEDAPETVANFKKLAADGFYADERVVTAVKGELIPESVSLRERPSTLAISAPAGAEVYVDGAFTSHGGEGIVLELQSGAHRLAVAEKGHRVWVRELELERGKSQNVRVKLEPTAQRQASTALFWSGAAALGAGAVFAAFAVRAESRARDFIAQQAEGNVTSAELSAYDSNKTDRNRYRAAAAISWASSAGLLIT